MPLLLNSDTVFSILLVSPYSHALEDSSIASLLVRDGEFFSIIYILCLSIYFLGVSLKVLDTAMSKGRTI